MYFDTISFLPLNIEDTRDSQIVISLSFRLKEASFIDAAWEQTIYASMIIDNKLDLSEYMTVLVMSDPDTAANLELDSVPEVTNWSFLFSEIFNVDISTHHSRSTFSWHIKIAKKKY